ncbi:MAG: alkaline phosphatase family protein [Firmicutes bacterium]|nr:alkaline phosphatase family protein [Bacillota bacterium]
MRKKWLYYWIRVLFLFGIMLTIANGAALAQKRENKFLVIHLDATSSVDLFRELEAGTLPNIAQFFIDGQEIKYGVSLFPPGTEMIIPRLKRGWDNSQGNPGWRYYDRETGRAVVGPPVFFGMISQISRLCYHQFWLGAPGLTNIAGLSLLNIDRVWETHDFAEFYWFHTDVAGHVFGHDIHLDSLKKFDYYFGLAVKAGKFDGANVVIYCDHGMSMDNVKPIRYQKAISDIVKDNLCYVFYPNIYLHDLTKKEEYALRIAEETEIDITLIKSLENKITGYIADGSFEINYADGKYQYTSTGADAFGYNEIGYKGEFLSRDDWLQITKDHLYPGAPPNLFILMKNDLAGDIVFVINPPKIPYGFQTPKGHHAGLTNIDLLVPLFLKGPAFEDSESIDIFWLHELYSKHVPMIDLRAKKSRENHSLSFRYPLEAELALSPAYRWRGGLVYSERGLDPWVEFDLYSSYIARAWVGSILSGNKLGWRLRAEAFLDDFKLSWLQNANQEGVLALYWRFHEQAEFIVTKDGMGLSVLF